MNLDEQSLERGRSFFKSRQFVDFIIYLIDGKEEDAVLSAASNGKKIIKAVSCHKFVMATHSKKMHKLFASEKAAGRNCDELYLNTTIIPINHFKYAIELIYGFKVIVPFAEALELRKTLVKLEMERLIVVVDGVVDQTLKNQGEGTIGSSCDKSAN